MADMIDRVAKAIKDALERNIDSDWDRIHEDDAKAAAIAAIKVMREPTEEQYDALCATDKMWRDLDSKTVWQTYIDAALSKEPDGPRN